MIILASALLLSFSAHSFIALEDSYDGGLLGTKQRGVRGDIDLAKKKALLDVFLTCLDKGGVTDFGFENENCQANQITYNGKAIEICEAKAVASCDTAYQNTVVSSIGVDGKVSGRVEQINNGDLSTSYQIAFAKLDSKCSTQDKILDTSTVKEVVSFCGLEVQGRKNNVVDVCKTALSAQCI